MDAHAIITVDLGFGDSGKGSIVDYLVRADEAVGTVIRYNGGPQAAHRVVAPDGRSHVFAQFGAGTLVPGVRTHLAGTMLVFPYGLLAEADGLRRIGVRDALARLSIDSECVLVTPYHIAANRALESARGDGRHGSCGYGIGEARADAISGLALRAGDCTSRAEVAERLRLIREANLAKIEGLPLCDDDWSAWVRRPQALEATVDHLCDDRFVRTVVWGERAVRRALDGGRVVLEGSQGVLLDESHGFHPYTTWTDTTTRHAVELLARAGADDYATLGIVRAYQTRHGAGPLPTDDPVLTDLLPDATNGDNAWQGCFRVGHLDLVLLRYALSVAGGVDALAVTCLDRAKTAASFLDAWRVCDRYEGGVHALVERHPSVDPVVHGGLLRVELECARPVLAEVPPSGSAYADMLLDAVGVPVWITSHGPDASSKSVRAAAVAA
jgi:adenylosuccinate synthase